MTLQGAEGDSTDALGVLAVGSVTMPVAKLHDHQRDSGDWSSVIAIQDPRTGRSLYREGEWPDYLRAAGACSFPVVGLHYHEEAQAPAFAPGQYVRVVPEPTNPVDPNALAIRSADGRFLAGYVPAGELMRIRSVQPSPVMGVFLWEYHTSPPSVRTGLQILAAASLRIDWCPPKHFQDEWARRAATFAQALEQERAEQQRRQAEAPRLWRQILGEATEATGVVYARNTCPYCATRLEKLPVRSMKCPTCREPIVRIRGNDYVVYLMREQDAGPLLDEGEAHWEVTKGWVDKPNGGWRPEVIRRFHGPWMARYAALGLGARVVGWQGGACRPCRALNNKVFDPASASPLPLNECRNTYCNCHYEPVMPNR
jgi:hypothetical protein